MSKLELGIRIAYYLIASANVIRTFVCDWINDKKDRK